MAEYPILLGAAPATLAKIRPLVLEYHEFSGSPMRASVICEHLGKHGFETAVEGGIFPQKLPFGTGIIKAWRK